MKNNGGEQAFIKMSIKSEVLRAEQRIRKYVRETPLEYSPVLSSESGGKAYLKFENLQITGSFKVRGALNKILSLSAEQRTRGIVAASTGNHGWGVANALAKTNSKGTVYVPHNASPAKVDAIKILGTPVKIYGETSGETESYARGLAEKNGQIYVSPYNDLQVIGGQGTIGIELSRQFETRQSKTD